MKKEITYTEKEVNYKVKCLEEAGVDTMPNKTYDCIAEYYHPDGKLEFILIIDDHGDEHSVEPEYFEKTE